MSATFAVMNPATGAPVASVPDNGVEPRLARLRRGAVAAFATWRKTTAYERAAILRALGVGDDGRRSGAAAGS